MIKDFFIYLSAFVGTFAVSYYFLSLMAYRKYEKPRDFTERELPRVSIIIPAYNEEETIKKTIESALGLKYPQKKFEILVINDGSKDRTYEIARKFHGKRVRVYSKENGGKAKALNFGITRAKGEVIVTMDADSYAQPDALRKMVDFFTDEKVMCVTPSMVIHNPKGFLRRVQQAEYLVGIFLRKSFSTMNAMHVTPGAFSAYRKSFFKEYGGFDTSGNMTEDMEMALRIQYYGYSLRCSDYSVVFTNAPGNFKELLSQRRRWYYGWIHNLLKYRKLFSKKYGHMGTIVLPVAVTSILLSIILTIFVLFSALSEVKEELIYLNSVNFSFSGIFDVSFFSIQRFLLYFFSKPTSIILVVFLFIAVAYMAFAKKRVRVYSNVYIGMSLFVVSYSLLLTFWWLIGAFYYFFVGKITWGKQ